MDSCFAFFTTISIEHSQLFAMVAGGMHEHKDIPYGVAKSLQPGTGVINRRHPCSKTRVMVRRVPHTDKPAIARRVSSQGYGACEHLGEAAR